MNNQYSKENIREIKTKIKEYHADGFLEPSMHLLITLIFIFIILYFIRACKTYQFGLMLLLALGLLRLFVTFHDLTHKSFFPSNERATKEMGINYIVASILEGIAGYDLERWIAIHSNHHAVHGNMNEYDGTRTVLTSSDYDALPWFYKVLYNIIRNPVVFFLVAPLYIFFLSRIIYGDIAYIVKYSLWLFLLYKVGSAKLMFSFIGAQYLAGVVGLVMFHLQHQVNVGYWKPIEGDDQFSKDNAHLLGASVLKIPFPFDFFTAGIEYHNVHHIDPGVPGYKIGRCYDDLVSRGSIIDNKIGYGQAFTSMWHTIFNEKTQMYE
jgi:omega-6 fatty acid desaturase (delta-12 desaturase)